MSKLYIGFDPGYNFGVAVVDAEANTIVHTEVIDCRAEKETLTHGVNFCKLQERILKILLKYKPVCVTIEDSTALRQFNHQAVQSLTGTKIAAMMACIKYNESKSLAVILKPPMSIKKAVVGSGKANKEDVINWVNNKFNTAFRIKDNHVTDAIAIACLGVMLCRTNTKQSSSKKGKS